MDLHGLYLRNQIARATLESPEHAGPREALRERESRVRERRLQRRRKLVARVLAVVARRRAHDSGLAAGFRGVSP